MKLHLLSETYAHWMFQFLFIYIFSAVNVSVKAASGTTDTITWGGDNSRSGYQTNHNLDPTVVRSADFGQIFKAYLPGNFNGIGAEQIYSQPLVYTGSDGIQYIYVATTQNNVYKLDAKTGAIIKSKNLHVPFLTADLNGCVDINPTVGVIATGVIDPETGIWYFNAKTYSNEFQDGNFSPTKTPGRLNGRYYQHAIHTDDLTEADNFPVLLDGILFRNNPNRMFIGGNQLSRPAALQVGDYIYTGYGSHCVMFNFTGAIIGFHKTTGAIVEAFATEAGPEPNTIKGGSIWMSGGGLAYDGKGSMYFATGNGYASQLKPTGNSIQGRSPPSALEEAAVNAKINDNGTISIVDFFIPWEKTQLDGADKDLGTTPLELLPTDVFSCTNHKRIGVITAKSGKTYWLNLDNLGGYQMGADNLDAVIQVYQNENSVYSGAGVMPLGEGYVYINVIQYPTHAFKFSCDPSGNAAFTRVADTAEKNAYILGVGHGTTSSLNGQEGTGMLWVSDVEGQNLRIYDAIPPSGGGNLTLLKAFNIAGVTKFTRPVFGDARVYIGTNQGYLYGFGSPVNLPLNCSSPYQFGTVAVGTTSNPRTVNCVANIDTTVIGWSLSGDDNFKVSDIPTIPSSLTKGQLLTFNTAFSPRSVGPLSSDVLFNTTNGVVGYSTNTPISLKGTANSVAPLLAITPNTVSFNAIIGQESQSGSATFNNQGDTLLTIANLSYSLTSETGPWITPNGSDGIMQLGVFQFSNIPSTISNQTSTAVEIVYAPVQIGNHAVYVKVFSDGGNSVLDVFGVASTAPVALVEFEKPDGLGWVQFSSDMPFTFGNVLEGQTRYLKLRVTNNGTANAGSLSITVSKPPYGVPGIVNAVNGVDLAEGTSIKAGQSQTAALYCAVPKSQVNIPSYNGTATWTLNTGDLTMGKQVINFTCNAIAEQVGPLLSNGSALYGYVGCFKENNPGRQLATSPYSDDANTNDRCINTCSGLGYIFAATQYNSECWCGNAIPIQKDNENDCNYQCSGNVNQTCGGNGYFHDQAHMSLFADSLKFGGDTTSPPLKITKSSGPYIYVGCYIESGGKTLTEKTTNSNSMTVEACATFCSGYTYFGLEYSAECYCGAKLSKSSTLGSDSQCSMTCKGSNSEFCGDAGSMQIYEKNGTIPSPSSVTALSTATSSLSSSIISAPTSALSGYISLGCYNETHDRRALASEATSMETNTLETCAQFCSNYIYFGVEYSSECYCDNYVYALSIKQDTDSGCSMPCAGNPNEICGGPDFLNIYYSNKTTPTPSSPASSSSRAATATATGPVVVPSAGGYTSLGCYNEIPGRALTLKSVANASMTVELCASFCSPHPFFAVEYSSECYCGAAIPPTSRPVPDGRCNMPCANNTLEICGGPNGLSMYTSTLNSTATGPSLSPPPTPVPTHVGTYVSLGCYTEKPNGRALATPYYNDSMSIELCAAQAEAAGWAFFGLEYGRECWMGNALDAAAKSVGQENCSMACPGNAFESCGAGGYLQLYALAPAVASSSGRVATTSDANRDSVGRPGQSSAIAMPTASGVVRLVGGGFG